MMRTPGKYRNVQRMPRRPNKSFEHSESRYSIFLEDPMQAPKLEFSEGRGSCIWVIPIHTCYCKKFIEFSFILLN
jgi:hypothetical protein